MKPYNSDMVDVVRFNKEGNEILLQKAVELLENSKTMVVFTGAGISTHSGIPDFRSPESGLWNTNDPYKVASLWAFHNDPKTFFDWIRPLSIQAESAKPNKAHEAIAKLEKRGIVKSVITQNIDGLHQKAGSKRVFELHGSARTTTCSNCGNKHEQDYFKRIVILEQGIPHCNQCGQIIKPDVILFGEALPQDAWDLAYQACLQADLIFIAGSSLEVSPANTLPELCVKNGARLIINNLGQTHLDSSADLILRMDVIDGLGQLPNLL